MTLPILDSPTSWVADHIKQYVDTNGVEGHIWRGVPCLLLTATGRKSGALRRLALIYGKDGNDCIIVASRGGDANHPLWYLNLVDNPAVTVQVAADVYEATASVVPEGAERDRLWNHDGKNLARLRQLSSQNPATNSDCSTHSSVTAPPPSRGLIMSCAF